MKIDFRIDVGYQYANSSKQYHPVFVWDGIGGWIMSILFLLFNIPFIIMQRFNRPRLITANMMLTRRNSYNSEAACKNEVPSEESTAMLCITEAAET